MRRSLAAVATAVALAGLGAAPAAAAPVTDPPARTQGCVVSSFDVVWDVAGVYRDPGGDLIGTRRYGNRVTGPSGYTSIGWTPIYDGPNYTVHWMRDASLSYRGCA